MLVELQQLIAAEHNKASVAVYIIAGQCVLSHMQQLIHSGQHGRNTE